MVAKASAVNSTNVLLIIVHNATIISIVLLPNIVVNRDEASTLMSADEAVLENHVIQTGTAAVLRKNATGTNVQNRQVLVVHAAVRDPGSCLEFF